MCVITAGNAEPRQKVILHDYWSLLLNCGLSDYRTPIMVEVKDDTCHTFHQTHLSPLLTGLWQPAWSETQGMAQPALTHTEAQFRVSGNKPTIVSLWGNRVGRCITACLTNHMKIASFTSNILLSIPSFFVVLSLKGNDYMSVMQEAMEEADKMLFSFTVSAIQRPLSHVWGAASDAATATVSHLIHNPQFKKRCCLAHHLG